MALSEEVAEEESSSQPQICLESERSDTLFNFLPEVRLSLAQVRQISPAALAYVGDAVYELYARTYYLLPPKRLQAHHRQVVSQVRAESQAQHLRSLEAHLTPVEQEIVKRGRNAATGCPRRLDPETYQRATSLETLMGYLFLSDPARLQQLFAYLSFDSPQRE